MSAIATGMPDHRANSETFSRRPPHIDADRLASLAALTMTRQTPGLVMPTLTGVPTSYTYTQGADTALNLARSLVKLGLGTEQMWKRDNGNLALFIRNSLNEWLRQIGAHSLLDNVSFDFAIVDDLNGSANDPLKAETGKLLILLETSDGCGFLTIGDQIELLEKAQPGLGRAFYAVLTKRLNQWMRIFDVQDAEYFLERWRESIEMDMEGSESEDEAAGLTFEEHCRKNDIDLPNVEAATPACLKVGKRLRPKEYSSLVTLLQQHRNGPYGEFIEPILAIDSIRRPVQKPSKELRTLQEDSWDDAPLPNWIVAFYPNDPITQAFDEESQVAYESSHGPTWLESFDPADVGDVRRVLTYVQRFVEVNVNLVKLSKAIEKGSSHASTNRPELDDELRAA